MKKSFFITMAALILSLLLIVSAAVGVNAGSREISWTQHTVLGDPLTLKGLKAEIVIENSDLLYWTTSCSLADGSTADTSLEYLNYSRDASEYYGNKTSYDQDFSLSIGVISFAYFTSINLSDAEEEFDSLDLEDYLIDAAKDVLATIDPEDTFSEDSSKFSVFSQLSDYCDYLPIELFCDIYDENGDLIPFDDDELAGFFNDCFQIPVDSGYSLAASLTVDEDKYIYCIEMETFTGDSYDSEDIVDFSGLGSCSIPTDNGFYFALIGYDDELYDLDSAGGYGIYLFTYEISEDGTSASPKDICLVYEMSDQYTEILDFTLSEDGGVMYLTMRENDGTVTLTVLDAADLSVLAEHLPVSGADETESELLRVWTTADGIGFLTTDTLSYIEADDDTEDYISVCCSLSASEYLSGLDYYYYTEELAYADYIDTIYLGEGAIATVYVDPASLDSADFFLLITDTDGNLFLEEYNCSLNELSDTDTTYNLCSITDISLTIEQ